MRNNKKSNSKVGGIVESKQADDGTRYHIRTLRRNGKTDYIVTVEGSKQPEDEIEPNLKLARNQLDESIRLHNQGYINQDSGRSQSQDTGFGGGGGGFGFDFGFDDAGGGRDRGRSKERADFGFSLDFGFGGSRDRDEGTDFRMERDPNSGRFTGRKDDDSGGFFDFLR